MKLQAWCNGYEVVAATSEAEAGEVLRRAGMACDDEDLEGDGWEVLDDAKELRDEDGKLTGETVGQAVAKAGKPMHLWSCEC